MFSENISLNEFRKNCDKWKSKLNREEKEIIKKYTDTYHYEITEELLKLSYNIDYEIDDEIKSKINILDNALLKFTFDTNILVKRIEHIKKEDIANILTSINKTKIFYYPNYISTSIISNFDKYFSYNWNEDIFRIIIDAVVPKGTNCCFLDDELSYYPEEKEILILRNCTLKILEIDESQIKNNTIYIKGIFKQLKNLEVK